ncbi:hypothetical protein GCM10010191_22880 [Actinomadura vinacea]|uniref:Asp23/Gls24 family envelope stress response protein n=1 Tax=Actinomadura vinacea TaxID=115336 RepID=A0ABP5VY98_9ACTN
MELVHRNGGDRVQQLADRFAPGQPDDDQAAAGAQRVPHRGERRGEVHVVDGRDAAHEVVALVRQVVGEQVGLDEVDVVQVRAPLPRPGDHLGGPVDPGDPPGPRRQPTDEQPVPATDVQRRTAAARHGPQHHTVVVRVVVPVAVAGPGPGSRRCHRDRSCFLS